MAYDFYRQLGTGVASITFGVALSIFIYAVASGTVGGLQAWFLFGTSFLLMLRFWWRYNELFIRFMPSKSFWNFVVDFLISFLGIIAVLTVNNIQTWAAVGALAMAASAVRCGMAWNAPREVKPKIKRTLAGAAGMLVFMLVVYGLAYVTGALALSAAAFVLVLAFVAYSSRKP